MHGNANHPQMAQMTQMRDIHPCHAAANAC